MPKEYLTICCEECDVCYQIPFATDTFTMTWRIQFSVCPNCKTPVNKYMQKTYGSNWRCKRCNVPVPLIKKFSTNVEICTACYFYLRRRHQLHAENNLYNNSNGL